MGANGRWSRTLVLCSAALLWAATAQATPLGLSVGDEVSSMSWDAFTSVDGDGAHFRTSLGTNGGLFADGRITSVTVKGPETINQSDVDLRFDLDLLSQTLSVNAANPNFLYGNAYFAGAASVTPDFVVKENGVNILWGNFSGNVRVGGEINSLVAGSQVLSGVGLVEITGGHAQLVNALGGAGSQADLLLTALFANSNPPLSDLASDLNIYNSDFDVSLSGTLKPVAASPFVPEPGTAILLGAGLLGLLAVGRRRGRA